MFSSQRSARWRLPAVLTLAAALAATTAACANDVIADPPGVGSGPTATASPTPAASTKDNLYFYPPVEGATFTYQNSGTVRGTTNSVIKKVTTDGTGTSVAVNEVTSGIGTPVTTDRTFLTSPDGGLSISAGAFAANAPGFKVTAAGDDIKIPPLKDLEAGKTATGQTFVEFTGTGLTGRNDVAYTVSGKGYENVTVPAGSARAYAVILKLDIKSTVGPITSIATYWILPGFGVLRQETALPTGSAITELTKSSVPLS